MKKLYWYFLTKLNSLVFTNNDKTYFRICTGLQNLLHFGFVFHRKILNKTLIWRWSVHLDRYTRGSKRINHEMYFC